MAGLLVHEGRMRVLALLLEQEWDVGSLALEVSLSQSALSQHLKKLRDAGVVETRRQAQTVFYSCKSGAVTEAIRRKRCWSWRSLPRKWRQFRWDSA